LGRPVPERTGLVCNAPDNTRSPRFSLFSKTVWGPGQGWDRARRLPASAACTRATASAQSPHAFHLVVVRGLGPQEVANKYEAQQPHRAALILQRPHDCTAAEVVALPRCLAAGLTVAVGDRFSTVRTGCVSSVCEPRLWLAKVAVLRARGSALGTAWLDGCAFFFFCEGPGLQPRTRSKNIFQLQN